MWDAVMQPEALLVERVLDGTFGRADDGGQLAFDEVARAYAEAMSNIPVKPSEIDSVVTQLELLSRFHRALSVAEGNASGRRVADRLLDLAQRLRPGRTRPAGRSTSASLPTSPPNGEGPATEVEPSIFGGAAGEAPTLPKRTVTRAAPKAGKRARKRPRRSE